MIVAKVTTESEKQLLQRLAAAVRSDNLEQFCEHTQMGVAYFDQEKVGTLLNEELPLILDSEFIPRLLKFLAGADYAEMVKSLLTELAKVMAAEGLTIGIDFSYGESADGIPCLHMMQKTADKIESIYEPYAWKQCSPYLVLG